MGDFITRIQYLVWTESFILFALLIIFWSRKRELRKLKKALYRWVKKNHQKRIKILKEPEDSFFKAFKYYIEGKGEEVYQFIIEWIMAEDDDTLKKVESYSPDDKRFIKSWRTREIVYDIAIKNLIPLLILFLLIAFFFWAFGSA